MLLQVVIQLWYITVSHQITTLKLKHSQHLKQKQIWIHRLCRKQIQTAQKKPKYLMIQNILLMSRYLMIVIIKTEVTAKIMMSGMIWMKELMRIRMKLQAIQWTTG